MKPESFVSDVVLLNFPHISWATSLHDELRQFPLIVQRKFGSTDKQKQKQKQKTNKKQTKRSKTKTNKKKQNKNK